MFRAILVICLMVSGCSNIGVDAWNEPGMACPDSDYDNGGNVEIQTGYCKSGLGFFVLYERKVNL